MGKSCPGKRFWNLSRAIEFCSRPVQATQVNLPRKVRALLVILSLSICYDTGDKPLVEGQGLVNPTLLLENVEYIEVNNLEITNTGPTAQAGRMGVYLHVNNFGTAHDVKVKNLYVHDG